MLYAMFRLYQHQSKHASKVQRIFFVCKLIFLCVSVPKLVWRGGACEQKSLRNQQPCLMKPEVLQTACQFRPSRHGQAAMPGAELSASTYSSLARPAFPLHQPGRSSRAFPKNSAATSWSFEVCGTV